MNCFSESRMGRSHLNSFNDNVQRNKVSLESLQSLKRSSVRIKDNISNSIISSSRRRILSIPKAPEFVLEPESFENSPESRKSNSLSSFYADKPRTQNFCPKNGQDFTLITPKRTLFNVRPVQSERKYANFGLKFANFLP